MSKPSLRKAIAQDLAVLVLLGGAFAFENAANEGKKADFALIMKVVDATPSIKRQIDAIEADPMTLCAIQKPLDLGSGTADGARYHLTLEWWECVKRLNEDQIPASVRIVGPDIDRKLGVNFTLKPSDPK